MAEIEVRTKNLKSLTVGELQAKISADGTRVLRYYIDFWHKELDLHKDLSAPEIYLLQGKVDALMAAWDKKLVDHRRRSAVVAGKDQADQMTVEAAACIDGLSTILAHTLGIDDRVDWESLKDNSGFRDDPIFRVPKPLRASRPQPNHTPPQITFWDKLFGRRHRKFKEALASYELALQDWRAEEKIGEVSFNEKLAAWNAQKLEFEADFKRRKAEFLRRQAEQNGKVDALALGVALGEMQSVVEHATLVLEKSDYSDLFEKSFEVDYVPDEKTLLIEYSLPSPDEMPVLKTARFIAATGEIKETHLSEKERKANYDATCYQICLRTIHEVFEADEHQNLEKVLFNGFASYVDRSTGRDVRTCIMSILVDRQSFEKIDLSRVDPKACFKSLKGVSASTLSALAAIPPVMELNKEDRRFVTGRESAANLSSETNLAAMDWEDFEHLVRELFEKEFASRGGEVRVTQASSDGGVDAVAFDPDPITGGKIVIQAKRYTRTVGVTAVRDLYGTMQHEGASRGILITTADYGPDAYSFAAGKPMTLFTGSNLLHLLEKHGYKAKIDLREARKELNLRDMG